MAGFRTRSLRFKIVYLIVTTVVCLGILEGVSRLLNLAPPLAKQWGTRVADPVLPYRHRPSVTYTGRSETDEYDYEYIHNSVGFRDVEHDIEKPEGVYRISATYQDGTEDVPPSPDRCDRLAVLVQSTEAELTVSFTSEGS